MNTAVEDVKSHLNIIEVIGSYVKLEKAGLNWKARCPFHNEKSPSFMVSEERQSFHCFGCNKGGDVFTFLMEMESLDFKEALSILAERAGIDLSVYRKEYAATPNGEKQEERKPRLTEILELATKFFEKQLWDGVEKTKILSYLRDRGLSDASIKLYRLGYAPEGWRHLSDFLVSRGYRPEEIEAAGLTIKKDTGRDWYDRFRNRITFPVMDAMGRVIGFSARVAPGGDESQAKYVNTPETSVYRKSKALYGLAQAKHAIKKEGVTVVVEGNMDVIATYQSGIENVVAVSGTALTVDQLDILKRYGNKIKFFFDMDGAGQVAARRSTELALGKEIVVSIVAITSGKDAADAARENPEILRSAVSHDTPALEYFLEQALSKHDTAVPEGKRAIAEWYLPILSHAENVIERTHFLSRLAFRIGMDEKALAPALEKELRERRKNMSPVAGARVTTSVATSFGNRSEILRENIIGLALIDTGARGAFACLSHEKVVEFLTKHPLAPAIMRGVREGVDPLVSISDTELQALGTKLSFQAEETLSAILTGTPEERSAAAEALLGQYVGSLDGEIRKERLTSISRALESARKVGDKPLQKSLMEEFTELSRS
ncbi:MAG: DNA primase [Candidatus Moraniibacteriota bacterium]